MYSPIRISLILNFVKKIPKVPITCKIDSRSEVHNFFSFYSYINLLFLEFLKLCEDTLSVDGSHTVFLERY